MEGSVFSAEIFPTPKPEQHNGLVNHSKPTNTTTLPARPFFFETDDHMIDQANMLRRKMLLRFLDNFFAHFWRNILPLYLMVAFGIWYFFSITPTYLSHGVLYIQNDSLLTTLTNARQNKYIWVSDGETIVEQFDSLLQTDAFARAILQRTNWEQELQNGVPLDLLLTAVRGSLWGEIKGEKHVHIVAQSDDPEIAFQLAEAAITLYRQWKVNLALSDIDTSVGFLEEVMADYEGELASAETTLRTYLIDHPDPAFGLRRPGEETTQIALLNDNIDNAERRILETRAKIDLIKIDQNQTSQEVANSYLLVDSPEPALAPEYTMRQRIIVFFIFVGMGILLSIGAGIGTSLMDKTYRFPVDMRLDLDLPVLGRVAKGAVALPAEMLGVHDADPTPHAPIHLPRRHDTPPTLIISPVENHV